MKIVAIVVSVLIAALLIRFIILGSKSQKMTVEVGLKDGKLLNCKSSSNCVSSQDVKDGSPEALSVSENPMQSLNSILKENGLEVLKNEGNYIWAIEKSKIFGFVDDIEFHFDEAQNKLHFRSGSRVGKSDLGVNKKRIQMILGKLKAR